MIIPLIHHKNSGFKVLGVYLSPAAGGGKVRKNSHFVSSAIQIKIGRKKKMQFQLNAKIA
nr:hypothetical protein [uncultured Ruminococcus sp.]